MNRWRYVAGSMGCCLLLFMLNMLFAAQPCVAQAIDLSMTDSAGIESSVFGLGAGYAPDYEGSNEYEAVPLMQARVNWGRGYFLSLLGNTLRANLVPSRNWHLGPVVRYRAERDDVEDDEVDLLEEVDAAVELGIFAGYSGEHWLLQLTGLTDAADAHNGSLVELGLGYKIPFQTLGSLTMFAATSYADSDYMDSYFGIDTADSDASGLSVYDADSGFKDASAGLAWQYNFNRNWGMLALAKYTRLLDDAEDSPVVDDEGDADQVLAGIIFNYRFAKKQPEPPPPPMDSDGDGVTDDLDRCPDTPQGVQVDRYGCPLDSDGDGVADYLDECPDTPAGIVVDDVGCPPDSDGDGVPDYLDQCPDTPAGAAIDKYGCPLDTDGDGVPDYLDQCPGTLTGVQVDEKGCPLTMTLDILFDFDDATIKPEFKPELDRAAEFIQKYKDVPQIVIEGHTDSRGAADYNAQLSEDRAEAVRQYLVDNYPIDGKRLVSRGLGEASPIADNTTEAGRAKNRRVEVICCAVLPE